MARLTRQRTSCQMTAGGHSIGRGKKCRRITDRPTRGTRTLRRTLPPSNANLFPYAPSRPIPRCSCPVETRGIISQGFHTPASTGTAQNKTSWKYRPPAGALLEGSAGGLTVRTGRKGERAKRRFQYSIVTLIIAGSALQRVG